MKVLAQPCLSLEGRRLGGSVSLSSCAVKKCSRVPWAYVEALGLRNPQGPRGFVHRERDRQTVALVWLKCAKQIPPCKQKAKQAKDWVRNSLSGVLLVCQPAHFPHMENPGVSPQRLQQNYSWSQQ